MKKILSIFVIAFMTAVPVMSQGAVTVKKAASVTAKKADKMESATSLLPSVIGLVGSVKALSAQQQQLEADCVPTSDELNTVNNLVKEWAKIGESSASDAVSGLGDPCKLSEAGDNSADSAYRDYMEFVSDGKTSCYLTFSSESDKDMIWEGYPKASSAKICEADNAKKCKTFSNLYDVFTKIPFAEEDLTIKEANKVTKLIEKSERCAPAKITAAKRQLWGGFLTQTLGTVGQTTGAAGTGSVIEAVSAMGGSGNLQSIGGAVLPSLGQFLDK